MLRPGCHRATKYTNNSANDTRAQVGQSYVSSVYTTLFAMLHAALMVVRIRPDLVLVNGPGEPAAS